MATKEVWKDVEGYENIYQVSSFGNVRNVKTGKVLSPCAHRLGYVSVMLYKNHKAKRHNIHRLVALAFLDKTPGCLYVNHIDENKSNNHVDNLEWCTAKYNLTYGTVKDRISAKRGHEPRRCGRKVVQKDKDGNIVKIWDSIAQAAKETQTARNSIQECCNGLHRTANNYCWFYL